MQEIQTKSIRIDYIEFNVHDIAQTKAFYANLAWTFTDFGEDYCEFDSGQLKGGFLKSSKIETGGALIILYSEDLSQSLQIIKEAGGIITQEIFAFPGGKRFHFQDINGYTLAIWSDQ